MTAIPFLTFKLLIVSIITSKRQLIHNRSAQRSTWNLNYDFVVVGAGSAGCIVASRLSEDPNITVLLLEAGGPVDAIYTDFLWYPQTVINNRPDLAWHYYAEPQANVGFQYPGGRIPEYMGRSLGGSSALSYYGFNRGNRRNFDIWAQKYGAVGWSYKDVMPYFLRSENNTDMDLVRKYPHYHAVGGPLPVSTNPERPVLMIQMQRALELFDGGYYNTDFNGPNQTGTAFLQQYIDTHGFAYNSATAYIDPNRQNLHVITSALVIRIMFNGTKAVGVEFDRDNTLSTVYARREVILSAGPYNSPQLLMLSGVGLRDHLQQFGITSVMELPVGNNLMDKPSTWLTGTIIDPAYYFNYPSLNIQELSERYLNNSGPLGIIPVLDHLWCTPSNPIKDFPNVLNGFLFTTDGNGFTIASIITQVRSRGTIRLQSASPYIPPMIDPNYLVDSRDFQDQLDALKSRFYLFENPKFNLSSIARLPTFESMGCTSCPGKYMYECTEGLICVINFATASSYHAGGSCRMGSVIRDDVVVDPQLRVKNLNNLRVCDSSIFPELPNATPLAAAFMVGEKCAQLIKDCYQLN